MCITRSWRVDSCGLGLYDSKEAFVVILDAEVGRSDEAGCVGDVSKDIFSSMDGQRPDTNSRGSEVVIEGSKLI